MYRCVAVMLASLILVFNVGCQSMYYSAWEKMGYHKRDILVERVEEARDAQEEAKEQFATALERFTEVVEFDGGNLESKYKKLDGELGRSESRAEAVRDRINSVERVAQDLFNEWEAELEQFASPDLRRRSASQLQSTRYRYGQLRQAMRRAEDKMEPVLAVLRDQVLYLKHNLNARALASLQGVAEELDQDVARLIRDMQASIEHANAFIDGLK